ncbi:DNA polymerase Y family protein [Amaricoccus sp.]|uniref:Y-family DNA polymerase n=1 Tax=Amaricoccus sp. TaxID=1872485 RepID=UPI001B5CE023|nr:DNA polymerase Y family protein [Amaricoccus sp.]MBP7002417.1 DNA polymerase Y family protein [Amaricoccus sp.]
MPSPRRILSIWFPRLAAERILRGEPLLAATPLAVIGDAGGALHLASLSAAAETAGLRRGMALGDARAIRPDLVTRPENPAAERAFLAALGRWAGRFSPWIAVDPPESLALDISGCARLFGGEAGLLAAVAESAGDMALTARAGIADTLGGAWALARFVGAETGVRHAGDAIDQEARATRSRAQKRRWERGGPPPPPALPPFPPPTRIAPPDETYGHLATLPVGALRITPDAAEALRRLGLARIGDIAGLPRAQLARRFGPETLLRLDQALGRAPEPISPTSPDPILAVRLTLPEPVGLEADVLAAIDRLLPPLCERLRAACLGARRARLTLMRVDRAAEVIDVGLARPTDTPEAIRSLLALKLGGVDAGFGIEALRLEALATEPVLPRQQHALGGSPPEVAQQKALDDLIGRLGARLGLDRVARLHPADSHIPEKGSTVMAAAFAPPAGPWPRPPAPRPAVMLRPEPVRPVDDARPPQRFVWRRREWRRAIAFGPERIAPEWWLDDPAWRAGPRDYWRVETTEGQRLWLYEVRSRAGSGGWFAQGIFL